MAKRIQIIDDVTGKVSFDETADLDALAAGGGDMVSSNNLSDLNDASTARANLGVDAAGTDNAPDATTTVKGKVEKSTSAENVAGTSDVVYPTVAGTKEMIDTHGGAGAGNVGVIQAKRTTSYALTATPTDINFDTTDIESDNTIIEHDSVNTDRVHFKESAYFYGTVNLVFQNNAPGTDRIVTMELRKNDTTVLSSIDVTINKSSYETIHRSLVLPSSAIAPNDYVSIRLSQNAGTDVDLLSNSRLIVFKMK